MIVFDGYITGATEKYFKKKYAIKIFTVYILGALLSFPFILFLEKVLPFEGLPLTVYAADLIALFITFLCFFTKRFIKYIKPKRIIINNDVLICQIDKDTKKRKFSDVVSVYDYGEFFEISFFREKCSYFMCQKSLISEGSIEEFEALFEGKIIKKVG